MQHYGMPMSAASLINAGGPIIGPSPTVPTGGMYGFGPIIKKPDFPQDVILFKSIFYIDARCFCNSLNWICSHH